jgi:hypothetical protein
MKGRKVVSAFISLPFEQVFDPVFETVSKVVMLRGFDAIRAHRAPAHTPASDLTTVARDIRESRFIIADLTGSHPNILQDVHYAIGLGKLPILITQDTPEKTEFHVPGLTIYQYDLEDLGSLQSLLLKIAANLSRNAEDHVTETPFDGVISAKVVLRNIVPGRWKNPFADDRDH